MFIANWSECSTKPLVVLRCSYRQYYRGKANIVELYGKVFTSELDIQHWNSTKCINFIEFTKTSRFAVNTAVIVFHLK